MRFIKPMVASPLTFVPISVTFSESISSGTDAAREAFLGCAGECGARGRACNPRSGGLGHHLSGTTTGARGASLDWDRQGRVMPAQQRGRVPGSLA